MAQIPAFSVVLLCIVVEILLQNHRNKFLTQKNVSLDVYKCDHFMQFVITHMCALWAVCVM